MTVSGERSFGKYEVISPLGAGGMGEVYLALDSTLDRKVAIKTLGEEFSSDKERLGRFIREAKATSALNHPNILTIHEIHNEEGSNYIVSEYVNGTTVKDRLRRERFAIADSLDVGVQISSALAAAHDAGIVHRDIKPDNVMIRKDGIVKVLDFGIAKIRPDRFGTGDLLEAATLTKISTEPGMMIGTPRYMSPEQARGRPVDHRSDVFSLGVVLYEMLSGKPPFRGESVLEIVSSVLKDVPRPLFELNPDTPSELDHIVEKCIRKDPNERYQDIRDLLIDLQDLRDDFKLRSKSTSQDQQTSSSLLHETESDSSGSTIHTAAGIASERRFSLFHAAIFVAVLAGALAGSWWFGLLGTDTNIAPGPFRTKPVASWSSGPGELFSNAAFSPDGKLIAFSSTKSGTKNIWVTQSGSTEAIEITKDEFRNRDPIWSPSGDELAYFSEFRSATPGEPAGTGIWRVSALGGTPRSIGRLDDDGSRLRRWVKSGKIYYQSERELYLLDASGGNTEKVTSFGSKDGRIVWVDISPDEKRIAFVRHSGSEWTLWEESIGDKQKSLIAKSEDQIDGAAWLPEKGLFFYSVLTEGDYRIYAAGRGGKGPVQVRGGATDGIVLDVSPDGANILTGSAKEGSDIWSVDTGDRSESPVASGADAELWPAVSPDSKMIAFQSIASLNRGNHLFDDLSSIRTYAVGASGAESAGLAKGGFIPRFSPDGKRLAYMRFVKGSLEIAVANSRGGGEKVLAAGGIPSPAYSISPYNRVQTASYAWSKDGGRIAYISERNGASNIWIADATTGRSKVLTDNKDRRNAFYCPIWSADGQRIAYFSKERSTGAAGKQARGLWVYDEKDETSKAVYTARELFRLIGWSADGKSLIIAASEKFGSLPPEIMLASVRVDSGSVREIATLSDTYFYNIHLSKDAGRIAFVARRDGKDDVWLMPANGGKSEKLTSNNDSRMNFSSLAWSPDGRTIFFGKQTRFSILSMLTEDKE